MPKYLHICVCRKAYLQEVYSWQTRKQQTSLGHMTSTFGMHKGTTIEGAPVGSKQT